MRDVVIAGYLRTAQSRSRPNDPARDWFHKLRADELLAKLLPEVIKRTGLKAEEIDDFIVGSSIGVNEQWAYGGRTKMPSLWTQLLRGALPCPPSHRLSIETVHAIEED